ncbi:AlkZ-related protein [Acetanaerobacterium elongatum]|uniref:Winged helix DNA-binding domain-containing protein n=1 Tax=Acetanaerobacterium elongatum TaxID=258515 RepID=A0A1G9VS48_9FIRM|nr:hypothetical protein [Acetanaerobacterium elongatum]SDM74990.1 hypothetical protein SAMN05192585_10486 [Acetanaerobacterium elongatum]
MLNTYHDFVARVNELGYYPFYGRFLAGVPTVEAETAPEQWHTGDEQTDPWQWKDRAAKERKLAFGCILGGYKGFVSKGMYPLFYAANRPAETVEERYLNGEVSQAVYSLYRLFENGAELSTSELRRAAGTSKNNGVSRTDAAMKQLQKEYLITVCGNRRRVSADGQEFGWPANTYCLVEDWAPEGWLDGADALTAEEARNRILKESTVFGKEVDSTALSRLLFGRRKS